MLYGLSNLCNLLLILCRFIIFSQFVDQNQINAQSYSFFAFCNVIIPFLLLGASFGQNAVYARFYKEKTNQSLLNFYKVLFLLTSVVSIFSFSISYYVGANKIIAFSITQFTLNFLYHQKRYEKIYSAVILNLIEITSIIFLVTFLENPTYRFENLFLIYLIIIFFGFIDRFRGINLNLKKLNLKNNLNFNFKNMLYTSPMFIKDNVDVFLLGLTSNEILSSQYALVILASVPSKVLLSTLQITLNKYFADKNIYYTNIFKKINFKFIVITLFVNLIIPVFILKIFFTQASIEIYIASLLRSIGLIAGFKMRATYLDNIQISTNEGIKNYKKGIFYSFVFIGVSYLIFKLLPSIYLLSMFPIFISIIGNIFLYKKN